MFGDAIQIFALTKKHLTYRSFPPFAQVAQSVEQRTENPRVGGSNPSLGTISYFSVSNISSCRIFSPLCVGASCSDLEMAVCRRFKSFPGHISYFSVSNISSCRIFSPLCVGASCSDLEMAVCRRFKSFPGHISYFSVSNISSCRIFSPLCVGASCSDLEMAACRRFKSVPSTCLICG